jgi:hypothetical protein
MVVSINGGTLKLMVYNGKFQSKMDDNWGYPYGLDTSIWQGPLKKHDKTCRTKNPRFNGFHEISPELGFQKVNGQPMNIQRDWMLKSIRAVGNHETSGQLVHKRDTLYTNIANWKITIFS